MNTYCFKFDPTTSAVLQSVRDKSLSLKHRVSNINANANTWMLDKYNAHIQFYYIEEICPSA